MRTEFHVVSRQNRWQVSRNGVRIGTYVSQDEAAIAARAVARNEQPSQVVVHRADGRIQNENDYEAGSA